MEAVLPPPNTLASARHPKCGGTGSNDYYRMARVCVGFFPELSRKGAIIVREEITIASAGGR